MCLETVHFTLLPAPPLPFHRLTSLIRVSDRTQIRFSDTCIYQVFTKGKKGKGAKAMTKWKKVVGGLQVAVEYCDDTQVWLSVRYEFLSKHTAVT